MTYMYLLPEVEQTYLKQPIPPHPPQPAQSDKNPEVATIDAENRNAATKYLAEDLEKNAPRPRSPHMDNEEPIEMAHYPGGHAPDPGVIPPIEREDFPAPPYPYAVEELKRRLSSSSAENDDNEDDYDESDRIDEEKLKRAVEQLDTYDKDSSIAHVIKLNLEALKKQKLPLHWDPRNASRTPSAKKMPHLRFRYDTPVNACELPLHWDPRNASRTPSAKKMPHLRFRYDTPVNASPSRHINRPKPWVYWEGQSDKAATTSIPFFHIPWSRVGMTGRAATLPDGYQYGRNASLDGLDTTISTHFSDQSLNGRGGTLPDEYRGGTVGVGAAGAGALRSSLPDMSKPAKIYPLTVLQTSNKKLPDDVDRAHLERHLNRDQFEETFSMSPIEFYKLPEWKRINLKRKAKLF
ncbi:unnamed protein product [Gongylonema pulchrum]|uniref:HP domain-containing protein n=1 Tax=Gongylonema pulchrum TaxID=637853 RepID=A0A3P7LZM9_9BILA|nr:unnamed protein product [Gongylonema pulchrum]